MNEHTKDVASREGASAVFTYARHAKQDYSLDDLAGFETAAADLISDVLHAGASRGADVGAMLRRSQEYYMAESEEVKA